MISGKLVIVSCPSRINLHQKQKGFISLKKRTLLFTMDERPSRATALILKISGKLVTVMGPSRTVLFALERNLQQMEGTFPDMPIYEIFHRAKVSENRKRTESAVPSQTEEKKSKKKNSEKS